MMNADKLNYLIRKISEEQNLNVELVYRNYMYERFLERLSKSKYRDDFIIKGGFLIGSMIGIDNRVTKDIDLTLREASIEKQKLIEIFHEISQTKTDDNIIFEYKGIKEIREQLDYPGYRLSFDALLQKTRIHLQLDVSTGDIVVPDAINYRHKCIFEDKTISIRAYSLETVLSEKLESIISWGIVGSRLRDYYDIYVLVGLNHNQIDYEMLRKSLQATSSQRGTLNQLKDYQIVINDIKEDIVLQEEWNKFQNTYEYARDIEFIETILIIEKTLNKLIKVQIEI